MTGSRLIIIRIGVMIVVIVTTFAMAWYLFTRFWELKEEPRLLNISQEEVNNPRINKSLLEGLTEKFEARKLYTKEDQSSIQIEEKDPFYE